jgi:MFS family permease
VENQTDPSIRSSAQGLFMMMTNGFGAIFGSVTAGWVIQRFFTQADGSKEWPLIWFAFAAYALVVALLFAIVFKYKHQTTHTAGKL